MIIGAGPAGSSLAAVLARRGWHVRLFEQRRRFGHKVCGEFISWEAQGILQSLGLLAGPRAAGPVPLRRAVLSSRSGLTAAIPVSRGSWGLSRRALDTALAEAAQAAGAELSLGVRVLRFERVGERYLVEARSNGRPFEIECRALVAASGRVGSADLPPRLRPPAAEAPPQLQTPRAGPTTPSGTDARTKRPISRSHPGPRIGIKQHYANVRMPPQVELYFFDGGYVGLAPVEGGAVNLCLLASRQALDRARGDPAALIEALAASIRGIAARLDGAEPLHAAPLAAAPIDLWRTAEPWDSIPCVGDAAAMIPPLAGDGIAAALRSVELCAPLAHAYLTGDITITQWEQAYRLRWHAAFDAPLALARRLETLLGGRLTSDLLLALGFLLPAAARRLANLTRSRAAT